MMTMMTPLGGWGVWDLDDDMMTQHNKVATEMIHHPFLMIFILIVTLLASTDLSITAPDDVILERSLTKISIF